MYFFEGVIVKKNIFEESTFENAFFEWPILEESNEK